jgi:phytoene dehydrogenase-like protein
MAQHHGSPDTPIVIIGAGLSGLTAASRLTAAGRTVLLLDASDGVGGRVRTDRHPDGYLLDRGFQVLLDGYPALKRNVELDHLGLEPFDAGAWIWTGKRRVPLADPRRHPQAILRDLSTRIITASDKAALAKLAAKTRVARWQSERDAAAQGYMTTEQALRDEGFSDKFIERFARPFWAGILLDPSLGVNAGAFRYTLKMMLEGRAVLPAGGMQAVPDHLAARLANGALRLNTRVTEIIRENGRATGVIANGERIDAAAVIIATDPPAARHLTGDGRFPEDGLGCVTVYLAGERDPKIGKRLLLDGTGRLDVNNLADLTAVQPGYAPPGQRLLAAFLVGADAMAMSDAAATDAAHEDTAIMLGQSAHDWKPVGVVRVPFAQFAQPPGIYARLPQTTTDTPGLIYAGESTVDSSVNGAMLAGEAAAKAALSSR